MLREGEIETSSARRLLCSAAGLRDGVGGSGGEGEGGDGVVGGTGAGGEGAPGGGGESAGRKGGGKQQRATIKRGRFLGPSRAFAPLPDLVNVTDSRVFLLTAWGGITTLVALSSS